jgi:putative transposase
LVDGGGLFLNLTAQVQKFEDARAKLDNERFGFLVEVRKPLPYYGSPRMTAWLCRQGYHVNHKRVERLMAIMGLEAIHPGPNTSKRHHAHKIYPYLLSGVKVVRPNQVWSTDITYIRMAYGFIYLVAIMDWFSRYVLSWRVSITLDVDFCIEALDAALAINRPEIFNSDQGCQFTSKDFAGRLEDEGIRISMDGRGRVFDNIFVERLWRTPGLPDTS